MALMTSTAATTRLTACSARAPHVLRRTLAARPSAAPSRSRIRQSVKVTAYNITFQFPDGTTQTIPCSPDRYLLDAAQDAGLTLPHSCTAGTCCACAVRMVSGELDTADQVYLDEDQLAQGFALICSSKPKSDCTVLTHQEEALYTSAY